MDHKSWMEIGRAATRRLSDRAAHGKRQRQAEEVAKEFGLTRQSLRNLLSAYSYTSSKSGDAEYYSALSGMSYAGIEGIRRWSARSPEDARRYAIYAATKGLSVRDILNAEKLARLSGTGLSSHYGSSLEANILRIVDSSAEIRRHLEGLGISWPAPWTLSSAAVDHELLRAFGVSLSINTPKMSPEWSGFIGLMEVAQRDNVFNFKKDAKAILTRAVAASTAFPLVMVAMPSAAAMSALRDGLPTNNEEKRIRRLPSSDLPQLLAPSVDMEMDQWSPTDSGRPVVLRPSAIAGAVMFLSREHLE